MKPGSKEIALIQALSEILGSPDNNNSGLVLGIGDDAAILKAPGNENLIVTTDCLIENIHFKVETISPRQLGWKSVAVNLSDIASMGGLPLYGFVSIAIPPQIDNAWIKSLYQGIKNCSDRFGLVIAGGDTSRSPHELMINVAIIGKTIHKKAGLRSLAKPGDVLFATGYFGASAAGFSLMEHYGADIPKGFNALIKAHLEPEPRLEEGSFLLRSCKRLALIDSSDGLANALQLISLASRAGIEVDEALIPISTATQKASLRLKKDPVELALNGGEDYELVGACSLRDFETVQKGWNFETPLRAIGRVVKGTGVQMIGSEGKKKVLDSFGYDHFRKG